jgi:hypothetical protein
LTEEDLTIFEDILDRSDDNNAENVSHYDYNQNVEQSCDSSSPFLFSGCNLDSLYSVKNDLEGRSDVVKEGNECDMVEGDSANRNSR